jgi:hypothetical protein
MIYISLIVSLVLLGLFNLLIARTKYPTIVAIGICCLGLATCPVLYVMLPPPLTWQVGPMCMLLIVMLVPQWGRRLYVPLSCVATLVAYAIFFRSVHEKREEWAKLKQEFPYESLVDRLPNRNARNYSSPSITGSLDELEDQFHQQEYNIVAAMWTDSLRHLHENSVDEFVNRPGFGFSRMDNDQVISEIHIFRNRVQDRPPVRQPDYLNPFITPYDNLKSTLQDSDSWKILRLHNNVILDFVNPNGLGYAKDREHIAGFQKHGISKVPEVFSRWSVAHLDLVGLVVHEKPVVYLSANLPQMGELHGAATRPLDQFEIDALDTLRHGEDLYFRRAEDKGRMIGAIRAAKQCLVCHGGSRGDLLGAFTYLLRLEQSQQ